MAEGRPHRTGGFWSNLTPAKVIGLGALFVAVPWAAQWAGQALAGAHRTTGAETTPAGVMTLVTRQPSQGVTEGHLSTAFAAKIGEYLAARIRANMARNLPTSDTRAAIRPEATVVEAAGHRLVIVRVRVLDETDAAIDRAFPAATTPAGATPIAFVIGVSGGDLVKVMCVDQGGGDVAVTSGTCNARVREALGFSARPPGIG